MASQLIQLEREQLTIVRACPTFDSKLKKLLEFAPANPGNSKKHKMALFLAQFESSSSLLLKSKRKQSNPAISALFRIIQVVPRGKLPISRDINIFLSELKGKFLSKNVFTVGSAYKDKFIFER